MKKDLLNVISQGICNLGKVPKLIITYGTLISFILLIITSTIFYINNVYFFDYSVKQNCMFMIKSVADTFAEVIIGGLLLDIVFKRLES